MNFNKAINKQMIFYKVISYRITQLLKNNKNNNNKVILKTSNEDN